jgi:hypothetical protein
MSQQAVAKKRPFGVTLLAILAGVAAVLAAIHCLQALGILPYNLTGAMKVRSVNLWNAFMWGLLVWVYVWLVQMLWRVDPQAWLFLAVITVFDLILAVMGMAGSATWSDYGVSFVLNALILIYIMLPSTKRAFGTAKP